MLIDRLVSACSTQTSRSIDKLQSISVFLATRLPNSLSIIQTIYNPLYHLYILVRNASNLWTIWQAGQAGQSTQSFLQCTLSTVIIGFYDDAHEIWKHQNLF